MLPAPSLSPLDGSLVPAARLEGSDSWLRQAPAWQRQEGKKQLRKEKIKLLLADAKLAPFAEQQDWVQVGYFRPLSHENQSNGEMEEMKRYQTLSAKAVLSPAHPRAEQGREGKGGQRPPSQAYLPLLCPQEVLRKHRQG